MVLQGRIQEFVLGVPLLPPSHPVPLLPLHPLTFRRPFFMSVPLEIEPH